MRSAVVLAALLLSSPLAWGQPSMPHELAAPPPEHSPVGQAPILRLEDALTIGLESHPSLRRKHHETRAEEALVDRVVSDSIPRIFLESTYKDGFPGSPNFSFRGLAQTSAIANWAVDGVLQWTYDFGRTRFRARSQRNNVSSAKAEERVQMAMVALRVVRAYHGLLLAQALAGLEESNLTARTTVARYAELRFKNGLISRVDVGLANAGLAEAKVRLIRASNDVLQARAALENTMGVESIPAYAVEEAPAPAAEVPGTLAEDLKSAFVRRPELKSVLAKIQAGVENERAAQAGSLPVFRFQATGGYVELQRPTTPNDYAYGMALVFPLYTGGAVEAETDEAGFRLSAVRNRAEEVVNDLRLEVTRARLQLASLLETRPAAAERVRQAADSEQLATSRYRHGLGGIIELQQAQFALLNARIDEARLRYDTLTAFYALSYARGDILVLEDE